MNHAMHVAPIYRCPWLIILIEQSHFSNSVSYRAQSSHVHRERLCSRLVYLGLALYYISLRSNEGQRASRVAAAALDRAQQLRRSDPARPTARREAAIVTTRKATTQ